MASFQRGNSGPGIMGPGRPPVSMEYGAHMSLRSIGRGFPRPTAAMVAPGRLNQNEINVRSLLYRNLLAASGGLGNLFFHRYSSSSEVIIYLGPQGLIMLLCREFPYF